MADIKTSWLVAIGIIILLISQIFYVVDEREEVVKFRFGKIVSTGDEPGLYFKWPILEKVIKFDDRILTINNRAEDFLTSEKKNLFVDFFIKWRVSDGQVFYRTISSASSQDYAEVARDRLLELIKPLMRNEFAKRTVREVVSAERSELMDQMIINIKEQAEELGIYVVDVRVKRIDLPDSVSDAVFNRMREERGRVAAKLRAEGEEQAERIRAEANRERVEIESQAYREAEEIKGEGDAEATQIYASAHTQNPEFYSFHRSLEAYRKSLNKQSDILILSPDGEFFDYFDSGSAAN